MVLVTNLLTVQINARILQNVLSVQAIILLVIKAVPSTRISSVPRGNHSLQVTLYQLILILSITLQMSKIVILQMTRTQITLTLTPPPMPRPLLEDIATRLLRQILI